MQIPMSVLLSALLPCSLLIAPLRTIAVPTRGGAVIAAERTLTAASSWRLSLSVQAPGAEPAEAAEPLIATIVFEEEEGYEPPQGTLRVESTLPDGVLASGVVTDPYGKQKRTQRWALSEDPDDPKDSLWIWGLFKEPLYPFILSSLKLEQEWAGLPAGTELFLQGEHKRDPKVGTRLGDGTLTLRESLALPGGADAGSAFEPVACGTFTVLDPDA